MPTICSYVYPKVGHQVEDNVYRHTGLGGVYYPEYFTKGDVCQFCGTALEDIHYKTQPVSVCWHCGWWHFAAEVITELWQPWGYSDYYFGRGIAKYFNISSMDVPLEDLRKYLVKHPHNVAHTHYTRFEQLMADCLKSAYRDAEVMHVGGVGDGGIDLILVTSCGDRYLVQVKRRKLLDRNEGVKAVRELNGVLFRESRAKGMLISTAAAFTKSAIDEAEGTGKSHADYEMVFLAFPEVVDLLNLPRLDPYTPWKSVLDNILPKQK